MIKAFAKYLAMAIIGAVTGIASALYMAGLWSTMKPQDFGDIKIGGWFSDFAIGSDAADPYTRARVARHGLLALAKSEAVYFTTRTDKDGQPFSDTCTYSLTGGSMPAKWWSITLYNEDSYLPDNDDAALSVDATSVQPGADGSWSATISAQRPQSQGTEDRPNWISSRNAGRFDLTLRLYEPEAALLDTPQETLKPPVITQLSCEGDAS